MGKLVITVDQCRLMRAPSIETVNPRIRLEIDELYKFQTRIKNNTFKPTFGESFTVSNTHLYTIVNVQVYHVSSATPIAASEETLLGGCNLSIEWAVRSRKRSRSYVLVSKDNSSLLGTVNITLKSDSERGADRSFSDEEEDAYVKRLTCFLMVHDRSLLRDMDLIMSSVKGINAASKNYLSSEVGNNESKEGGVLMIPKTTYGTFEELMTSLCNKYKCSEPARRSLSVVVEGCTDLESPSAYTPLDVFVVLRTECEEFVTIERPYSCNPVWFNTEFDLDVLDPDTYIINVMVVNQTSKDKCYELGRTVVRINTLSRNRASARQVFVFNHKDQLMPTITGVVHLVLRTERWDTVPRSLANQVDEYYLRLNRFFYRYDQRRLSQVDSLIHARLYDLNNLMSELEILYGCEPGTMELWITIHDVYSLHDDNMEELDDKKVGVLVTMGEYVVHTQPKRVKLNSRTVFNETFVIDVARETDMIKIEVKRASRNKVIYGRADFTCVKLQRGVKNHRVLYLVGKAATDEAYLSGMISISFFSEQLGQPWCVDLESESMYAGRLRRYVQRRVPSKLHLVDIAVCTVFDIDNFFLDIAREYGEESPTYVVYVNVLGCRDLKARLGFSMNAYVVARMGIERYETHVVRGSTEPDFFHFVEFYFDNLEEAKMNLVVMEHHGLSRDSVIGRVDIELGKYELQKHHHTWCTLFHPDKPEGADPVGLVGVKFIIKNLSLKDNPVNAHDNLARSSLMRQSLGKPGRERASLQWRGRLGVWRNRIARVTAHLRTRSTTSSSASSEVNSPKMSEFEASSPSVSLNLMDEGIHSINEFRIANSDTTTPAELTPRSSFAFSNENRMVFTSSKESNFDVTDTCTSDISPDSAKGKQEPFLSPFREKKLRVRVLCCEYLQSGKLTPPSPYVMLSTLFTTHQTMRQSNTASPRFNEEFLFSVKNPFEDFLSITVITETPYGKKCLGHCVLSMRNVQRDTPRTRWVSLVSEPHRPGAKQQGRICLTIMGENFGLCYLPSIDAENRLRALLIHTLMSRLPEELHRLEYYIGEYLSRESELTEALSKSTNRQIETKNGEFILTVTSVTQLFFNDHLVENYPCLVKIKINGNTIAQTKPVYGVGGRFEIKETCKVNIPSPAAHPVRVVVYIEKKKKHSTCGECLVSLENLHLNVTQERTHILVMNAGLPNAKPVGYITLSFLSSNFGSSAMPFGTGSENQYIRMRDYYFYYLKPHLHSVGVKYSSTFNVEAHLKKLVETNGPEPGRHSLRVQIVRCHLIQVHGRFPYCILRVGLQQYKTKAAEGDNEYAFRETFNVQIGLPEKEEMHLILMMGLENADDDNEVEAGRIVVPLTRIMRGHEVTLNLPLFHRVQTKNPRVNGSVEVILFTDDFGNSADLSGGETLIGENVYKQIEVEVSQNHPENMYLLSSSVADGQEHEGQDNSFPHSAGSSGYTRISIVLVALLDFPEENVYIRAKANDRVLLRTESIESGRFGHINEHFYLETSRGVLDSIIVFKLAKRHLGRSNAICFCELAICNCPHGAVTTKSLRLFDSKWRSLGRLQVKIDVPSDAGVSETPSVSDLELESITDDIASLAAKYIPRELCRLDVVMSRSTNLRELHCTLRQHLAKNVLATVYCVVHRIDLLGSVKGHRTVEVSLQDDVVRVVERKPAVHVTHSDNSQGKHNLSFPYARLDLVPDFNGLLLCVFGSGEGSEVGRTVVSLRALLTPGLYDMGEEVTVPLVKFARRRTDVGPGTFAGTITFSLVPPSFEKYPPAVQLPNTLTDRWRAGRPIMRYYFNRVCSLLKNYDANSLVHFHHVFYEEYVTKESWTAYFEGLLDSLVEKWGPEVETFDSPSSIAAEDSPVFTPEGIGEK